MVHFVIAPSSRNKDLALRSPCQNSSLKHSNIAPNFAICHGEERDGETAFGWRYRKCVARWMSLHSAVVRLNLPRLELLSCGVESACICWCDPQSEYRHWRIRQPKHNEIGQYPAEVNIRLEWRVVVPVLYITVLEKMERITHAAFSSGHATRLRIHGLIKLAPHERLALDESLRIVQDRT